MKNILYIFLLVTNCVYSQNVGNNQLFEYSDTSSMVINVYGNGNYGSSIFSNEFIDKFRFGGFVDNTLKDATLSRSKRLNYLGGEGTFGISFSDPIHKLFGNWGYYVDISSNYSSGTQFTDGLYELAFYGNKKNAGDTIQLRQTGFHARKFSKFTFGIDDNNLKLGLSFLSFSNYSYGLVQGGGIYTDSLGNNISMDLRGSQVQSNNVLKHVGTGIALDFEYRLSEQLFSKDSSSTKETTIIIGVKNIGVYISRKNSVLTEVDTTYNYNGFEVSSLSNFGNSVINQQQLSDTIAFATDTSTYIDMLPFEIYFYKPPSYLKKFETIYGFRYKIQSNYRAFIYFGGNYHTKKGLNIVSYIGYGGYSRLQFGLGLNKRFKNLVFEINSANLFGFFSKNQFGKAAGMSIKYNLR